MELSSFKEYHRKIDLFLLPFTKVIEAVKDVALAEDRSTLYAKSWTDGRQIRLLKDQLTDDVRRETEAIAAFPLPERGDPFDPNNEIGTALGSRSFAFAFTPNHNDYDLFVLDTSRALQMVPPESQDQRASIIAKIEQMKRKRDFPVTRQMAIENRLVLDANEPAFRYVSQEIQMDTADNHDHVILVHEKFLDSVWKETSRNADEPKFEIKYNEKWGWHWVAAQDVPAGEVLSIEECFSSVTFPETRFNYCSYCTIWCEALIPCAGCTMEMYCSESCRRNALESYHRVECQLLPWLRLKHRESALLVLRTFLTGTGQGSKLRDMLDDDEIMKCLFDRRSREGAAFTEDYYTILSLMWGLETTIPLQDLKFAGAEQIKDRIDDERLEDLARIYLALHKRSTFFGRNDLTVDGHEQQLKLILTRLLLFHHAAALSFNLCDINAKVLFGKKFQKRQVAIALPQVQCLLNHSCYPNVEIITSRRHRLVFSVRPIEKGQQISVSWYCNDFVSGKFSERKNILASYGIAECACRVCGDRIDWPLRFHGVQYLEDRYRQDLEHPITDEIRRELDEIRAWVVQFNEPNADGVIPSTDDELNRAKDFLQKYRQYYEEPSPTVWMCEDLLKRVYVTRSKTCPPRAAPPIVSSAEQRLTSLRM